MSFEIVLDEELAAKYTFLRAPRDVYPLETDMAMPTCALNDKKCVNDLLLTRPKEKNSDTIVAYEFDDQQPRFSNCQSCVVYKESRFKTRLQNSITVIFHRLFPQSPKRLTR